MEEYFLIVTFDIKSSSYFEYTEARLPLAVVHFIITTSYSKAECDRGTSWCDDPI